MSAITAIEMTALQGAHPAATAMPAAPSSTPEECLTFRVGSEDYGIDILRVQEIRSYEPPTRLAGTSPLVVGVTNLRGVIVPLVDLRLTTIPTQDGLEDAVLHLQVPAQPLPLENASMAAAMVGTLFAADASVAYLMAAVTALVHAVSAWRFSRTGAAGLVARLQHIAIHVREVFLVCLRASVTVLRT